MADNNVVYDPTGLAGVVQRDAQLLTRAKGVFGDVVTDAWVATFHGKNSELAEAAKRLAQTAENLVHSNTTEPNAGVLNFDACDIVLQFSNGAQVQFTNSEWASMSRVDVSTMMQLS